eukprot:1254255-Rhodomonas_salina.4
MHTVGQYRTRRSRYISHTTRQYRTSHSLVLACWGRRSAPGASRTECLVAHTSPQYWTTHAESQYPIPHPSTKQRIPNGSESREKPVVELCAPKLPRLRPPSSAPPPKMTHVSTKSSRVSTRKRTATALKQPR